MPISIHAHVERISDIRRRVRELKDCGAVGNAANKELRRLIRDLGQRGPDDLEFLLALCQVDDARVREIRTRLKEYRDQGARKYATADKVKHAIRELMANLSEDIEFLLDKVDPPQPVKPKRRRGVKRPPKKTS